MTIKRKACPPAFNTLHSAPGVFCISLGLLSHTKEFLLFDILQAAGWPIWLLLVASVIALALVIERLLYLRRRRILPPNLLNEVIRVYHNGKINNDVIVNLENNSPLGRVLASG